MATIALSAAGMAFGGSIGGSILGLSMATIGRAAGAAIGRRIDQQLMGSGSEPVETGRIDRFRVTGANEGADIQQVYGRMRVAGQVIWASQFQENSATSGGGKGSSSAQPTTTTYSYSVSLAVALCEGVISRVGRVWADGEEISPENLNMRVYAGTADQLPDPKIAVLEGAENTPAYRGTAYVVLEDLALGQFGNRIPQLTFEVMRAAPDVGMELAQRITGTALMTGTGEYALATSQVYQSKGFGSRSAVNTNSPVGGSDFTASMDAMQGDLPACGSVVLPVVWFGDDLRCGDCTVMPKVTQGGADAPAMPWRVSSVLRSVADTVAQIDDAPAYDGTPADAAVIEAITDLHARGLETVFYPLMLMEQIEGNALPDPWIDVQGQPILPWRGRVTTSRAPGVDGTPDGTSAAAAEVAAFLGSAAIADFSISGSVVSYNGPTDWGYRRFILHYANVCAAAGGVSAFCLGSQMVGLTQVRGPGNSFPFVDALRALAGDVRTILGPDCKISYAADWTEYHGHTPAGTQDKFFHLDPLWADPDIDFVAIDNFMPLADWRDTEDHLDAQAGSIYSAAYLKGNVAGGEGFDWYYTTPEARAAQRRTAITDPHNEPWMWQQKAFADWWGNPHHPRVGGVRDVTATAWVPESKPLWFTTLGCPAIDKAANRPGRILDPRSDDAVLPDQSTGNRDDMMQMQYLTAVFEHFVESQNNPMSSQYAGRMLATDRMHVWGWDARPYPFWPGNRSLWADGSDYALGHWLNGRATNRSLASVVAEICERSGVQDYDVSALFGVVRGYTVNDAGTGRAALQPLMLAYGFDAVERDGVLVFRGRTGAVDHQLTDDTLALNTESDQSLALTRAAAAEITGRVQLAHVHADGDYDAIAAEIALPDEVSFATTRSEVPLVLTRGEGERTVARWLQEARIGRDTASFAVPPSHLDVGAGDVVELDTKGHKGTYRVDRVEDAGLRLIEATRIEPEVYRQQIMPEEAVVMQPFVGPVPAELVFMDLPLLTGDELPHAPYVAASGRPWPGSIAVYGAPQDSDYALHQTLNEAATLGMTQTALARGPVGVWDRQAALEVALVNGALSSATQDALLAGANTIAIGDGSVDQWEIMQFQNALPISERGYALTGFLRGQAGTGGMMPDVWPVGSRVVLMNTVPTQIVLPTASRGNQRHFRFGPAKQPITDPSYRYEAHAFQGNGLRPYPVVHLRTKSIGGDLGVSWIRSSRIDGGLWADGEIPLGEDSEAYVLRIRQGAAIRREVNLTSTNWTYSAADRTADVGNTPYVLEVAQLSDRFGAGPFVGVQL